MKNIAILISLAFCLAASLNSCSNPLEEIEKAPSLAAKTVVATYHASSMVPGSQTQVFEAEIREYSDRTMDIIRSIGLHGPATELSSAYVQGTGIQASNTAHSFSYPMGGWYIPFDPGVQGIAIDEGGTILVHCKCDASGSCDSEGGTDDDGNHVITCKSNGCLGNCDAIIVITNGKERLQVGNGIFVAAPSVQVY